MALVHVAGHLGKVYFRRSGAQRIPMAGAEALGDRAVAAALSLLKGRHVGSRSPLEVDIYKQGAQGPKKQGLLINKNVF